MAAEQLPGGLGDAIVKFIRVVRGLIQQVDQKMQSLEGGEAKDPPSAAAQPKKQPAAAAKPDPKPEPKTKDCAPESIKPDPAAKPMPPATPNPKGAEWKNLHCAEDWCPPVISSQYADLRRHSYRDSETFDQVVSPTWRVAGATRRGRLHAHKSTHREDAAGFRFGPNHTTLCVADGAGSSKFSRVGSHLAIEKALDYLEIHLARVDAAAEDDFEKLLALLKSHLTQAVLASCLALRELAVKAGASPKDFRSTLLLLLHFKGAKAEVMLTCQIGDGAIVALMADKTALKVGVSDSGEFSGEVSCFVPDECAMQKAAEIQLIPHPDQVECVALCTDGIEDPFYPMEKNAIDIFRQLYLGVEDKLPGMTHQPRQGPILGPDSPGAGLGLWLGFEKRGENDDRTLLLMQRFPATLSL